MKRNAADAKAFKEYAGQCREMAKKLPSERATLLKMAGAWEAVARDAASSARENTPRARSRKVPATS
jgi:hypothetical protein